MQKVQVLLLCDDHAGDGEATQTVYFSFDGKSYSKDLCEGHGKDFRRLADTLLLNATRSSGKAATPQQRTARRATDHAQRLGAIRQWAVENGVPINERGRIPAQVVAQYDAAH